MNFEAPPDKDLTPRALDRKPPSRRMRAMKRVAVLHNVDYRDVPPERDPAWSARAEVAVVASSVAAALCGAGHDAQIVPVDGDLAALRATLAEMEPDCVFNLCESLAGDARLESAIPLMLELLGYCFTGSPASVLSLALRKDRVKGRLQAAGIPTPAGQVLLAPDDACYLPFPLIVKPVREDGSVGISCASVVHDRAELERAVDRVLISLRQPCLVEEYVDGREFNVALLGDPTPRVLPLSEIDFAGLPTDAPRIVSYEAKWMVGSVDDVGTVPVMNPPLPSTIGARVRRAASDAFRAVGVRDYGRVDVRLSSAGIPYVLDVNPNCDLSANAGMSRAAAAVGIDYGSLVKLLVRYALRRGRAGEETVAYRKSGTSEGRGDVHPS
jgi:D-alanine-D-alanine ligase